MPKSTPKILLDIAEKKLIKEYALFLKIKGLYSNSVVYNIKTLHTVLKCSRTKTNRIYKIIQDNNWGKIENNHLILFSAKNIHFELFGFYPKKFIQIESIEDIHFNLLKQKLQQKEFINKKVSDIKSRSSKVVKSSLKYLKGERKLFDEGISLKSIAATFNVSIGSIHSYLKKLVKRGLISIKRRYEFLGDFSIYLFNHLKETHKGIYIYKGGIVKNLSSKITLLEL